MADLTRALFLIAAFALAGLAQIAWFAAPWSNATAVPLDRGLTWRGRRIFGDHKTLRGFVVMIPATAGAFALLAACSRGPLATDLWPLSLLGYAGLGAWAGLGFMAGELPNSFLKRQLDIAPGAVAAGKLGGALQSLIDRMDSGIGMLLALSAVVPTPWQTWTLVLLVGPAVHLGFSAAMYHLGLKTRAA